ncbi:hypothetical protein MAIT1_03010 [Magnetofaba australis IT-1]|uniref:TVP38/TMEM64 family membrane protein n=2 Tax=Magnetofaba TaxID=1472292 RepID=A0A1Y2K5D5_9PROT|nr:hypothetical protein MAIT1_03010 [Magnetofaba australis IT-1]
MTSKQSLNPLKGKTGWRRFIGVKRLIALSMLAALGYIAWRLRQEGLLHPEAIQSMLSEHPVQSVLLFTGFFMLAVLTTFPSLPLNLAAGYFWGGILGGVLIASAGSLAAIIAFVLARTTIGQPLAHRFDNRIVAKLQSEFDAKGWRFVAFARLNPIMPTGALNYLFGLTSLKLRTYATTTFVFLLPPSIAFAILGEQAGGFMIEGQTQTWVQTALWIAAGATLLIAVKYLSKILNQSKE